MSGLPGSKDGVPTVSQRRRVGGGAPGNCGSWVAVRRPLSDRAAGGAEGESTRCTGDGWLQQGGRSSVVWQDARLPGLRDWDGRLPGSTGRLQVNGLVLFSGPNRSSSLLCKA